MNFSTEMIHWKTPVINKDTPVCINDTVDGMGDGESGAVCPTGVSHIESLIFEAWLVQSPVQNEKAETLVPKGSRISRR